MTHVFLTHLLIHSIPTYQSMNLRQRSQLYFQYLLKAKKNPNLDSSLVTGIVKEVLLHRPSKAGIQIKNIQKTLSKNDRQVEYADLGAGSAESGGGMVTRSMGQMAKMSSRKYREGELLHRLCAFLQPKVCLELGTHLGLSTLYQFSAVPASRFVTVEGAKAVALLARQTWTYYGTENTPELHVGNFDAVLPTLLSSGLKPDYVLIDGNHRYEPTISYARQLIEVMAGSGVIVFDDIYWSEGMKNAWEEIISWPEVRLSVNLFQFGIIFLEPDNPKAELILRWG